jgi:hypothetical protein
MVVPTVNNFVEVDVRWIILFKKPISSHQVPHVASGKQQLPVSHKVDILHFETRAQGLFTSNSLRNEQQYMFQPIAQAYHNIYLDP